MASFSRWSAPGFRVPTMSEIAGNMGEVLEHDAVHDEYITAGTSTPLELTTYNTGADPEYVRDAVASQDIALRYSGS
ncbi:hypothetical protein PHLCEN_2v11671 [Hermanssonia centrifuga]|uniref:Uncharacterized protein n=1 Tax=Hermanssonia centrifuga TaxID=98765 RepID=A0A2R6NJA2_9APHY|nr:hypothetical protein PHLCEN_2v11671 [Hermanssonia centrifuga]